MSHSTDAELLDLALLGEEADREVSRHVAGCGECARRFDAVKDEQSLLRRAFAPVAVPASKGPAPTLNPRIRWVAAAALLAAVGLGAAASLILTAAGSPPSGRHARRALSVRQMERDLDTLQRKISDTREAFAEPSSEPVARAYVRLLSEGEDCFVELMSSYCDLSVPLAQEQKTALKSLVDRFLDRALEERRRSEEEFLARLAVVLSHDQYDIVREYLRQEAETARTREIDDLLGDLAVALDLRSSEVEPLRGVLTQGYPKSVLAAIPGIDDAGEVLVDEPALTGRVRGALRPVHHGAFDAFLAREKRESEGVRRVMQTFRSK
jgi:hypothetical protein